MSTILFYILNSIIILIEPIGWCWLCNKMAEKKEKRNSFYIFANIIVCIFTLSTGLLHKYIGGLNWVGAFISNLYVIIYTLLGILCYKIDKKVVLCCISLQYMIVISFEHFYSLILYIILKHFNIQHMFQTNEAIHLYSSFLIQAVNTGVFIFLFRFKYTFKNIMKQNNIFYIFIFGLLEIIVFSFIMCCLFNNNIKNFFSLATAIISLVFESLTLLFTIYLLMKVINKKDKYKESLHFSKQQILVLQNRQAQLTNSKKVMHDMTNHLCTINAMAQKHMFVEIREYLQQLIPQVKNGQIKDNENTILSVILYAKKLYAKKENVLLEYEVTIKDIELPLVDLNSIITNILDNAIEACKKIKNKKNRIVSFYIYIQKNNLIIECQNPYSKEPVLINGYFQTDKLESSFHGNGIILVHEYVTKNGGDIDIHFKNGIFVFRVILDAKVAKQ